MDGRPINEAFACEVKQNIKMCVYLVYTAVRTSRSLGSPGSRDISRIIMLLHMMILLMHMMMNLRKHISG